MSALQNLPTDQDQFRQNLEGMGFQLPAGDLNDPNYLESLLTDFATQLEASGIDSEDFTTLVKNYEKQLISESGNSLKGTVKSSTNPNAQSSGSIALGTAAYLVAIQLALYELLNENMKFLNQMAADNLNSANEMSVVIANATKDSIKKDADKEKWGGIAKLATGGLGIAAHGGLQAKRAIRGSDAQKEMKLRNAESGEIQSHLGRVATSRTEPAQTLTAGGSVLPPSALTSDGARKMRQDILSPQRCLGKSPLTDAEHAFIKHAGLHDKVEQKLHVDNNKIKEAHGRENQKLSDNQRQLGEYVNSGTQMANSGTEIGLSTITTEKADLEVIKSLGESSKQGIQQVSRDAAEQASAAARQAEASLEVLKKLDSDKR
jgi:hypothetical protein